MQVRANERLWRRPNSWKRHVSRSLREAGEGPPLPSPKSLFEESYHHHLLLPYLTTPFPFPFVLASSLMVVGRLLGRPKGPAKRGLAITRLRVCGGDAQTTEEGETNTNDETNLEQRQQVQCSPPRH